MTLSKQSMGIATAAVALVMGTGLMVSTAEAQQAKNVILMISDGASWGTWDMASYWEYGQKGMQPYDNFGVKLGMTTYPLNTASSPQFTGLPQVGYDPAKAWDTTPTGTGDFFKGYNYIKQNYTDSAAAGTALAAGQATYNNAIDYDDFAQPLGYITQTAKTMGKATGILSSVPFSHATPATFGAQNISRNNYGEISKTMVNNPAVDLIMGGGNPLYNSSGGLRSTPSFANETGTGGGYISQTAWNTINDPNGDWQLIQSKADFEALANGTLPVNKKIIGVPQVYDTLQYKRSGTTVDANNPSGLAYLSGVPTLETMTKGAINVLSQNADGFFMMVEGGAVDWAAHANNTGRIIEEQIDFNKSVEVVVDWVNANSNWNETLVIVLTDHGNAMPMGPNSNTIAFEPIQNNGQGVLPGVRWHYGTHTNENTLLWAMGAGADLFYAEVDGNDPGLVNVLGFNDGRYINNTDVYSVMFNAMVPEPASFALLVIGAGTMLLRRRGC